MRTTMSTVQSSTTPLEEATVQRFADSLHGELLRPGDAGFDSARTVWNGMIDKKPALIARCAGVADVIQSRVGISAERGDPLGAMVLSSRARAQAVQRDATALLTACGLALRSFD